MKMGKAIAALDIGSTTIRCFIYDENAQIIASSNCQIPVLYPKPRWIEFDPEDVWNSVVAVVFSAMRDGGLYPEQITCLGLSCQRSTILTWRKSSGKPFHRLISWQDQRADTIVHSKNRCLWFKTLRWICASHSFIFGGKKALAISQFTVCNGMPGARLAWALRNVSELSQALYDKDVAFGTLSSWILYKLSGGKSHTADPSEMSISGMFDTFKMTWSPALLALFSIPKHTLPTIVDSAGFLFNTDINIFGAAIPVTASISDVSASMFGTQCFEKGSLNIILGTGTFVSINTGSEICISRTGLFPTVGWKIGKEVVYTLEGLCYNTAAVIKSAQNTGLMTEPSESGRTAASVPDTDGVLYVPAFSGLQVPVNDSFAAVGMVGAKLTTTGQHILRAMLESIAFRTLQIMRSVKEDTRLEYSLIRTSGGVSKNEFILQSIANLTQTEVSRPADVETSALGVAFLAGLAAGVWPDRQSLPKPKIPDLVFQPSAESESLIERFGLWESVIKRFRKYYVASK